MNWDALNGAAAWWGAIVATAVAVQGAIERLRRTQERKRSELTLNPRTIKGENAFLLHLRYHPTEMHTHYEANITRLAPTDAWLSIPARTRNSFGEMILSKEASAKPTDRLSIRLTPMDGPAGTVIHVVSRTLAARLRIQIRDLASKKVVHHEVRGVIALPHHADN